VTADAGNVTLLSSGGVGTTDGSVTVDLNNWANLSVADKAAIAGAEPIDTAINGSI